MCMSWVISLKFMASCADIFMRERMSPTYFDIQHEYWVERTITNLQLGSVKAAPFALAYYERIQKTHHDLQYLSRLPESSSNRTRW